MTPPLYSRNGYISALFSRALHAYFLVSRGLTLGVRAIVRSEDGKFLLVRHTYTPGWHFPGGGVEKGESARGALDKELRQETGLELIGEPVLCGVFHNNAVNPRDHVLVYLCDIAGTLPDKQPSAEIAEVGYYSLDSLPEGIDPGTYRRMREVVDGLVPSHAW